MMDFRVFLVSDLVLRTEIFYLPFRQLHVDLLGEEFTQKFEGSFRQRNHFTLFVAESLSGKILGFKSGYEMDASTYYSWTGGVALEARKRGMATALMEAQQDWCKKRGYIRVQTKSKNKFKEMLILNLKNGFDIVDIEPLVAGGERKIIFEKVL